MLPEQIEGSLGTSLGLPVSRDSHLVSGIPGFVGFVLHLVAILGTTCSHKKKVAFGEQKPLPASSLPSRGHWGLGPSEEENPLLTSP